MESLGLVTNLAVVSSSLGKLLIRVLLALVIFMIGRWIAKRIARLTDTIMVRSRLDNTVASFLSQLLYGLLLVIVVLAALNQVGVQTTSVIAILGGAALAVGVALKDQLSNFAAGIMIVIFRPFAKGDYVKINDHVGTVRNITLVTTHITTVNNHEVIIPNNDISTTSVVNYTLLPNRRVDVTVGISYDADIKTAKNIMLHTAKQNPMAALSPEPIVRVTNLGDNSVDLTINVWTSNDNWWALQCDLLEQFKYALDDNHIDIPFPQRTMHIQSIDENLSKELSKLINNVEASKSN